MASENENGQEKTEEPTPKKLEQMREQGQVAQSKEIVSVAVLLGGIGIIASGSTQLYEAGRYSLQRTLLVVGDGGIASAAELMLLLEAILQRYSASLLGMLGGIAAIAVGGHLIQFRPTMTLKPLTPDLSKLNPWPQLKSKYNPKTMAVELIKNLSKVSVVGIAVYYALEREAAQLSALAHMPLASAALAMLEASMRVVAAAGGMLIVIAALDLIWQRYKHRRDSRMTKEEVKNEAKDRDGSPEVKNRQRARAREFSRNRMMSAASDADVVIVNPTHFAVALRYRRGEDEAPRVVAKGVDHLALAIRKAARSANVPIIEDRPLARLLYRSVKLGALVPETLYGTVATILAHVYKMRRRSRRPRAQPRSA